MAAAAKYKLVIVESPAKAKTIGKFLGRGYKVEACNGHVRDLPKSQIGVDVENNFEPRYITIRGRGEILDRIRKEARGAAKVILATDPNLEGEATASYLSRLLTTLEIPVSRLASGLPVGGDLEFADEITLGRAFEGRQQMK